MTRSTAARTNNALDVLLANGTISLTMSSDQMTLLLEANNPDFAYAAADIFRHRRLESYVRGWRHAMLYSAGSPSVPHLFPGSTIGSVVIPGGVGANPLRIASSNNYLSHGAYQVTDARINFVMRSNRRLGGSLLNLTVCVPGAYNIGPGSEVYMGNDTTVSKMALEIAGTGITGTVVVPVTFSGSRQVKAGNAVYTLADPIYPGTVQAGLTVFPADATVRVRAMGSIPATGGYWALGSPANSQSSGGYNDADAGAARVFKYDPTANVGYDPIDATGALPVPSGSQFLYQDPVCVLLLGNYASPARAVAVLGDSIAWGIGDGYLGGTGASYPQWLGYGYCSRAMGDASQLNVVASLNLAQPGEAAYHYAPFAGSSFRRNFMRFCNMAVEEYGCNDITSTGDKDVTVIEANLQSIWTLCRGLGHQRIIRPLLVPRTYSANNWATLAGQSDVPGWGVGQTRDQLHAWLATKKTDGTIDQNPDTQTPVADAAATGGAIRWVTNGTAYYPCADGVHPNSALLPAIAAPLRAAILAATLTGY